MVKLTENMIQQRLRSCMSDISNVVKINITGRDLQDISLIRKMVNVEVLSLSVNRITTLIDLQYCKNLRELYLRKNNITNLNEICYLKDLPRFRALWLAENPCSMSDYKYRLTVIKNLPKLEKLDDIVIKSEERAEAMKRGRELAHPEEANVYQSGNVFNSDPKVLRTPPISRSPTGSDSIAYPNNEKNEDEREYPKEPKEFRRVLRAEQEMEMDYANQNDNRSLSQNGKRRSNETSCESFYSDMSMRNAMCDKCHNHVKNHPNRRQDCVKEMYANNSFERAVKKESYHLQKEGEQRRFKQHEDLNSRLEAERQASRLVTRNSNLLSAVLCLVKELDFPSLEVVFADVRCRLDNRDEGYRS